MKPSILITGASGFVGKALLERLQHDAEFHITAAVRKRAPDFSDDIKCITVGNISADTDWTAALRNIDVIVHLAARVHVMRDEASDPLEEFRSVNLVATEHLARSAAQNGVKRFVYVSTVKVNGEETTLDSAFTEASSSSPKDPYGVSKMEAECVLLRVAKETSLEVVIVRPPLVYGVGVKGNFHIMINALAKNLPLPLKSINNSRSMIYVENLVDALILCASHPEAAGQTFLLSDGENVSTPDLLRQLGDGMGHPARLFSFPVGLLKLIGNLFGKSNQLERLMGSLRVDSDKIRRELGWHPPYTLREGLNKTGVAARDSGRFDKKANC